MSGRRLCTVAGCDAHRNDPDWVHVPPARRHRQVPPVLLRRLTESRAA